MSQVGHEPLSVMSYDVSGLRPSPERLWRHSEPTLGANSQHQGLFQQDPIPQFASCRGACIFGIWLDPPNRPKNTMSGDPWSRFQSRRDPILSPCQSTEERRQECMQ
jgi:hypothetical protein